jgi:hypothetical protein
MWGQGKDPLSSCMFFEGGFFLFILGWIQRGMRCLPRGPRPIDLIIHSTTKKLLLENSWMKLRMKSNKLKINDIAALTKQLQSKSLSLEVQENKK